MDNLVAFYKDAENDGVHPLICAAWFHHAFTMIHPFQDGNGRVARLLVSLILIKHVLFPFTVHREEGKVKYIDALEKSRMQVFDVCLKQLNLIKEHWKSNHM